MAGTAYRALQPISRGLYPDVPAGEIVKDGELVLLSIVGNEEPVDFERLVELGVVEPADSPSGASKSPDAASDAPPDSAPAKRSRAAAKSSS